MKYKVVVTLAYSGERCSNGLLFDTRGEALAYAEDLFQRWLSISRFDIVEVPQGEGA